MMDDFKKPANKQRAANYQPVKKADGYKVAQPSAVRPPVATPQAATPIVTEPTANTAIVEKPRAVFFKKHKLAIIITAIILAIAIVVAGVFFAAAPVVSVNQTKLVNLDSSVRLEKGQTAKLKDRDVSVRIVNFTNDTCPKDVQCFWSGQGVEYTLTEGDKVYATGSIVASKSSNYRVETISSDYKTYAFIKITKPKK